MIIMLLIYRFRGIVYYSRRHFHDQSRLLYRREQSTIEVEISDIAARFRCLGLPT